MNDLKFLAMCRPLLILLVLIMPVVSMAASNNVDQEQKVGQTTLEREAIEERRKKYESLSKAEQKKVREARKKYKQMTPEERRKLKEKWIKSQGTGK